MKEITVKMHLSQPVRKLHKFDGTVIETLDMIDNEDNLIACVTGESLRIPHSLMEKFNVNTTQNEEQAPTQPQEQTQDLLQL